MVLPGTNAYIIGENFTEDEPFLKVYIGQEELSYQRLSSEMLKLAIPGTNSTHASLLEVSNGPMNSAAIKIQYQLVLSADTMPHQMAFYDFKKSYSNRVNPTKTAHKTGKVHFAADRSGNHDAAVEFGKEGGVTISVHPSNSFTVCSWVFVKDSKQRKNYTILTGKSQSGQSYRLNVSTTPQGKAC